MAMGMKETVEALQGAYAEKLAQVKDMDALESLRVEYLGRKGKITALMGALRDLAAEEKREAGLYINAWKDFVQDSIKAKTEALSMASFAMQIEETPIYEESLLVPTMPGSYHPVTLIQRVCEDIFRSMGFTIEDYPEIVDDFHCFQALNIPEFHPARDMQDTYYLSTGQLLKTHTSAAQNSIMRKYGSPLRAVFPGRCFRNEAVDASHENTFFQMEGMMIDKDISIANLIYFMKTMLSEVFGRDVLVRLRPGFFPFVEPGFELDINCQICGGSGCPSCKNSGWLELCPCGMIHPKVLEYGGIDPEENTGFAFGLGLTRLAMMKYGIKDIRTFNGCNLKALSQFVNQ